MTLRYIVEKFASFGLNIIESIGGLLREEKTEKINLLKINSDFFVRGVNEITDEIAFGMIKVNTVC